MNDIIRGAACSDPQPPRSSSAGLQSKNLGGSFDLIVLGAGPGGYRAAEYAAKHGLKVVIFESGEVGGTCLNVGCIPTKTYVHAASFEEARQRMPQVVAQLRSGVESILSHPNITLIRGKASFVDAHTVTSPVCGNIVATNILIATGSETKWLPIPGIHENPRVVDSTGLLALNHLPKRLAIIGAGVIGMEFASVFNRFGSEVTVIEYLKECLPALDSDIAKRLRKVLERPRVGDGMSGMKQGITFNLQCAVKSISDTTVTFENKKGQLETVDADVILMATGRKPRTEGLNLEEALGITLNRDGSIPVNDNYQLSIPRSAEGRSQGENSQFSARPKDARKARIPNSQLENVYAIGDVNGRQMLAHAAEWQAKMVVDEILRNSGGAVANFCVPSVASDQRSSVCVPSVASDQRSSASLFTLHSSLPPVPAAIFTTPEAACVGPTEDQLKAQGAAYECRKAFHRANGKALAMGETEGMLKLFSEPDAGRILGCHAFGAHSADMVQEVSALMCMGATIKQLRNMVHIHPTVNEILLTAATE